MLTSTTSTSSTLFQFKKRKLLISIPRPHIIPGTQQNKAIHMSFLFQQKGQSGKGKPRNETLFKERKAIDK
jgi:hypothetical protein